MFTLDILSGNPYNIFQSELEVDDAPLDLDNLQDSTSANGSRLMLICETLSCSYSIAQKI